MPTVAYGFHSLLELVDIPDWASLKIAMSAFFAWIPTVGAPAAFRSALGRSSGMWERLLLAGLLIFFWRGYSMFSLSDSVSVAVALGASVLLLDALRSPRRHSAQLRFLFVGFLLAAATNTRPSYLIVFGLALLVISFVSVRCRGIALMAPLAYVLGAALVLAPQSYINKANDRSLDPFKFSVLNAGRHIDGYAFTLDQGFKFWKYHTVIDDPEFQPQGAVYVPDLAGFDLSARMYECCGDGKSPELFSRGAYIRFVVDHPIEMGEMFARHVFSGMDLWWSDPYLHDVLPVGTPFRVMNYTIWYLALAGLVVLVRQPRVGQLRYAVLALLMLLLPVAVIVPSHVEARFWFNLHVLVYSLVAIVLLPAAGRVVRRWRRDWPGLRPVARYTPWALGYAGWIITCLTISDSMLRQLKLCC